MHAKFFSYMHEFHHLSAYVKRQLCSKVYILISLPNLLFFQHTCCSTSVASEQQFTRLTLQIILQIHCDMYTMSESRSRPSHCKLKQVGRGHRWKDSSSLGQQHMSDHSLGLLDGHLETNFAKLDDHNLKKPQWTSSSAYMPILT